MAPILTEGLPKAGVLGTLRGRYYMETYSVRVWDIYFTHNDGYKSYPGNNRSHVEEKFNRGFNEDFDGVTKSRVRNKRMLVRIQL